MDKIKYFDIITPITVLKHAFRLQNVSAWPICLYLVTPVWELDRAL